MKVGDLVVYHDLSIGLGTGIVIGFDKDNDPIIVFHGNTNFALKRQPFYRSDIEVVSESR